MARQAHGRQGQRRLGGLALGDRLVLGVPIVASTHLFEDLDFDSFLMIELVALVEHLADVREPPDELPVVETVGQCYELYLRAVGQSAAGKEEPGALR